MLDHGGDDLKAAGEIWQVIQRYTNNEVLDLVDKVL